MRFSVVAGATVIAVAWSAACAYADDIRPVFLGQWGGGCTVVDVRGSRACVTAGSRIEVLDISVPGSVKLLGATEPLAGGAVALAQDGHLLYAVTGSGGLLVYDVSGPSPVLTRTVEGGSSSLGRGAVLASDGWLYAAAKGLGFRIYSIADPAAPALRGSFAVASPTDLKVSGNRAYVLNDSNDLYILDISDKDNPVQLGKYDGPGSNSFGFGIKNGYAFIGAHGQGLQVVSLQQEASPALVTRVDTGAYTQDVAVVGHHAYALDQLSGLTAVDISVPSSPLKGGTVSAYGMSDAAPGGPGLCVAAGPSGLMFLSLANPAQPSITARSEEFDHISGLTVAGGYVYAASPFRGLVRLDISDPTLPRLRASAALLGARRVVEKDGVAYACADSAGIHTYDVASPAAILPLGSYSGASALECAVSDDGYAFVAAGAGGLVCLDVADPSQPGFLVKAPVPANTVSLRGNRAFITYRSAGLKILDITYPDDPQLVSTTSIGENANGAAVRDDVVLVASSVWGVRTLEISDESAPAVRGRADFLRFSNGANIAVFGRYGVLCCQSQGVRVLLLDHPDRPATLAAVAIRRGASQAVIHGDLLLVAANEDGLLIYRLERVPSAVAQAKRLADGSAVPPFLCSTTASLIDPVRGPTSYVQSQDRSSGLRVASGYNHPTAAVCTIGGVMRTAPDGERYLEMTNHTEHSSDGNRVPFVMRTGSIGGGNWHYAGPEGGGQMGFAGRAGLNNAGQLVRICGQVVQVDDSYPGRWLMLNDGSGLVKVYTYAPPEALHDILDVTGVVMSDGPQAAPQPAVYSTGTSTVEERE